MSSAPLQQPLNPGDLWQLDWLRQWTLYSPSSIALVDGDSGERWTYEELYGASVALASWLIENGRIVPGARVALVANNHITSVALFCALQRLGAILVPINFRWREREIAQVCMDATPSMIIADQAYIDEVQSIPLQMNSPCWVVGMEEISNVAHRFVNHLRSASQRKELLDEWLSLLPRPFAASADSPCLILYTSGTTGMPKGVMITPRILHWNSLNTTLRLNLSQHDVFVSFLPLFHTGGWNVLLTPFLHRGATTVLLKKFDAEQVLKLCASERATIMFGVPTTLEMMANHESFEATDLQSVRYAIVGGEPMPLELIRRWSEKGVAIRQGYGLTEFGPNVFSLNEQDAVRKIGSIGFPNFYIEARIVDAQGHDVPTQTVGELILRGPVCMLGYWNNPKATRETIIDGWLYTGDLVRRDQEGYYYIAGRKKDMYISGGENVYPVEVERFLSGHPSIREIAVVGVKDERWGEVGAAYVSLVPGRELSLDEMTEFCRQGLAGYKIPRHLRVLNELPKTESGKILKRALQDL